MDVGVIGGKHKHINQVTVTCLIAPWETICSCVNELRLGEHRLEQSDDGVHAAVVDNHDVEAVDELLPQLANLWHAHASGCEAARRLTELCEVPVPARSRSPLLGSCQCRRLCHSSSSGSSSSSHGV